jgi:hypothetical protein
VEEAAGSSKVKPVAPAAGGLTPIDIVLESFCGSRTTIAYAF